MDLYAPKNYPAATVQTDGEAHGGLHQEQAEGRCDRDRLELLPEQPLQRLHNGERRDTLSASNVAILTKIALQHHLQVEYRPIILVPHSRTNQWEGLISPYPEASWFNNYFKAELPYLKVAQRRQCSRIRDRDGTI